MSIVKNPPKLLSIILWLVAVHSFLAGLALVFMPISAFDFFGFNLENRFFSTQSGVFHIVICMAYIMGAIDLERNQGIVIFSFTVKFIAAVFLVSYYILVEQIITVLLSGIGDFFMGLVIILLYKMHQKMKLA